METEKETSTMIKLFISDVDGVMTDATYYVMPDGQRIKRFNTRDMYGISRLHKAGCNVAIITGDEGATCVKAQFDRSMPFAILKEGASDKALVAQCLLDELGIKWEETAYIGDDGNDLELLKRVGLAACPMNAVENVQQLIRSRHDAVVIPYAGGSGCVRDFADMIWSTWYNGVE